MPDTYGGGAYSVGGWTGGIEWHVDPNELIASVVEGALRDAADQLLEVANRTVPHRDGYLQDSGGTDYGVIFGAQVATIFYGGIASAYAVAQHEHPEWHHPDYDGTPRRGKWLERAAQEEQAHIEDWMAASIEGQLG